MEATAGASILVLHSLYKFGGGCVKETSKDIGTFFLAPIENTLELGLRAV